MGVGAMAEIGTIGQLLITFLFELITFIILLGDLAGFSCFWRFFLLNLSGWWGGRVVECGGLEHRYTRKSIVSSNLTPTANFHFLFLLRGICPVYRFS
ncbi:MAG: hypothetical protein UT86_C0004G0069 [Candidatus Magasanikbacteria bacterium GW2011_GWC2_40_17]|uniref:Transmembrane protein n=1 Tax=Candidatus Magasanikbacteria bacterium GW2011_GWA2_42_32 TaxID=1619039 RepID=A0A0G1A7W0_9BACT|nr:MAG: hypothetical protein UT86_C0004G0069 [Candidatus Magasanikbacteria bacterium GW2011_GWC2_40_17]KKS57127.1 MAG: hypothetical protein UV20_C0003G0069 [Candidatus Magasanikbacteria bacterium GW2011_GWA2_42_32]